MNQNNLQEDPINWDHAVYALGKLTDVIVILVEGEGDVRSRLHEAAHKLQRVSPNWLPRKSDIREKVEWVYATLTKFRDPEHSEIKSTNPPETIFDSTLRRIKNRTGSKVAGKLFGAWMDLSILVEQHLKIQ